MMRWKAWWVRGEPWMWLILVRLLTLSLFNILTDNLVMYGLNM